MNNQPIIKKHYESKILRRDSEYQSQGPMRYIVAGGRVIESYLLHVSPTSSPWREEAWQVTGTPNERLLF
jgi:hypothetical protein